MQSLLQYRKAGVAARVQLERDAEKTTSHSFQHRHVNGNIGDGNAVLSTEATRSRSSLDAHSPQQSTLRRERSSAVDQHADLQDVDRDPESAASIGGPLGPALTGINVHDRTGPDGGQVFIVGWTGPDDPNMPRNWPLARRVGVTIQIGLIGLVLTAASAIDSAVLPQAAKDLNVSEVAESLATGLYLAGMGIGSLVAGPFSEAFGRNVVYTGSLIIFMIWIMACALAPNFGAQITFRFLAGCCASAALVCTGGSVADMFNSLEKTWAFPLYAIPSFMGPMLGPVMGAYIGPSTAVTWRWAEWTMLIASGAVLVLVLLLMPETYSPLLLQWKAVHYRRITGDDRFRAEHEIKDISLLSRLKVSMARPFLMLTEPIIMAMTLYITVVYIVLFTFLVGWPYIFQETYGISQGLSHTIFVSMLIGVELNFFLVVAIYYMTRKRTKQEHEEGQPPFKPEIRLWFATFGAAVALPVSLFWLGWTNYSSISIWSAILAVCLFGYAVMGIFLCIYMYIIDAYEIFAASALTFVSLVRYVVAGGMTVAGIPLYESLGTHYTLTILACVSVALLPIPYLLSYYGHAVRSKSRFAAL